MSNDVDGVREPELANQDGGNQDGGKPDGAKQEGDPGKAAADGVREPELANQDGGKLEGAKQEGGDADAPTLENLLAGDDDDGGGEAFDKADGPVEFKPAEMKPEEVETFVEGMKLPDLKVGKDAFGNEVKLGAAEVKTLAPYLSGIGLNQKQSSAVIHSLAALEGAKLRAEVKAQKDLVDGLVTASKEKFGADIGRFVSEARKGGKALFGEAWDELKGIPAFCNDPRIIEALAGYGRSIETDDGASGKDAGGMNPKDFYESWIKSSNRGSEANG